MYLVPRPHGRLLQTSATNFSKSPGTSTAARSLSSRRGSTRSSNVDVSTYSSGELSGKANATGTTGCFGVYGDTRTLLSVLALCRRLSGMDGKGKWTEDGVTVGI